MQSSIVIDANFGEGGGAILRLAGGLAVTTHKTLQINNIRKNRPNPGLRTQHLMGIQALLQLTGGKTTPLHVGTTELEFNPGDQWQTETQIKIATAGNIGLLTQTIQNALFHAPAKTYTIQVEGGGTFGTFAPSPTYLNNVTFKLFELMGYQVGIEVIKHGFYPRGGAQVKIHITPNPRGYKGLILKERGDLVRICGEVHAHSRLKEGKVAERICDTIFQEKQLMMLSKENIVLQPFYHMSESVGVGCDLWAEFSSGARLAIGTVLGERGIPSEKIGRICIDKMKRLLKSVATVDEYASDQILPLMCIAKERSEILVDEVSSHCKTNLELLSRFYDRKYSINPINGGFEIAYD